MPKPKPVTINTPRDQTEERQHTRIERYASMGRAPVDIECPFCRTVVTAYLWSLAGGGKRCDGCGAKHTSWGTTVGWKDWEPPCRMCLEPDCRGGCLL